MVLASNPFSPLVEFATAVPLGACWDNNSCHFWRQYWAAREENWFSLAGWLRQSNYSVLKKCFRRLKEGDCFSWKRKLFEDLEFRKFQGFWILPYISVFLFWVLLLPDQCFLWKAYNFTSMDIQPILGIKFSVCFFYFSQPYGYER